jgi:hypothetical protein
MKKIKKYIKKKKKQLNGVREGTNINISDAASYNSKIISPKKQRNE